MKQTVILFMLPAICSAQLAIPADRLDLIGNHDAPCHFNLFGVKVSAPMFNTTDPSAIEWNNETETNTLIMRGYSLSNPYMVEAGGYFWERQDILTMWVFPVKFPNDKNRSTLIVPHELVKDAVCGCFARIGKNTVPIDTIKAKALPRA